MRAIAAIGAGITMLVVGVIALSQQASDVAPTAETNASYNASYATTTTVYESVVGGAGPGVVWAGVGAVVLIACGFLVVVGMGSR